MADRNEVYDAVDEERDYQDSLWGPTQTAGRHNLLEFLSYIRDYTEEALHMLCRQSDITSVPEAQHSLRKITALGVAAMEQNGVMRRGYVTPKAEDLANHGIVR